MNKYFIILSRMAFLVGIISSWLFAQMEELHGDYLEYRRGIHSGNKFRTTFYNDGYFGAKNQPPDIGGEWPINSGRLYMWDADLFVGAEVIDSEGALKHIMSEVLSNELSWSIGDRSPSGEPWTFLPLPGFANPDTTLVAMSKLKFSWPYFWPDKVEDAVDPGWAGSWNGYFGKNVFNADEESYSVSDDYANAEFKFYPDSSDLTRRGLGIRNYTRGFQWSNTLVEDILFVLYDFENVGTTNHDKVVFAYKFGNNMGQTTKGEDGSDDCGTYLLQDDVAFLYDYDDIGYGGFSPVGLFGGAFLESPGNPFDGIDNDGDGKEGAGAVIAEEMFLPETLTLNAPIVLIDYQSFTRRVMTLAKALEEAGGDTLKIRYQDQIFKYWNGKLLEENPYNLVDDNLNGLIDENTGSTFGSDNVIMTTYLYIGAKCVDYLTGEGLDNPLLDERRDDGIDNDHDWNLVFDDLGADGAPYTYDYGEGDGKPTFGEPHFDKTDIDETDMIGLTSFTLYRYEEIPHWEDELVWENVQPGFLDDVLQNANVELLYGSGFFPMPVQKIERFSMAILCGENQDDFIDNKQWASKAYSENYNFAKAPSLPIVRAVTGDKKVTLFWDDFAEQSTDPLTGLDFEGYRVYRSTDPAFRDMNVITDGKGLDLARKPLVQFDLINEYEGYSEIPFVGKGVQFWLGDNTGIVHTWTDTTVRNGFTYYYAVTAYDHGSVELKIPPSETNYSITLSPSGDIEEKGPNVVIARPEAPAAGYVAARLDSVKLLSGGTTTGRMGYKIMDPSLIKDGHVYHITFEDTLIEINNGPDTLRTNYFYLTDVTKADTPDTLIARSTLFRPADKPPQFHGIQVAMENEDYLRVDEQASQWSSGSQLYNFQVMLFSYMVQKTIPYTVDFRITFGEMGMDTSILYFRGRRELPPKPVNFTVTSLTDGTPIPFALRERDGEDGVFSMGQFSDEIILMHPDADSMVASWDFKMIESVDDSLRSNPKAGDYVDIKLVVPFLKNDVFQFTSKSAKIDPVLAENQMARIKVVPNPYIVGNSWEPLNPYANGRGPRELHFNHLPSQCTIRIYNVVGQLVQTVEHNNPELNDGTFIWDMRTMDNLDIAYGVYIYHVDAGYIGEKIGKFAVIK